MITPGCDGSESEGGGGEVGMACSCGVVAQPAIAPGMMEAAVLAVMRSDGGESGAGHIGPIRLGKQQCRVSQARDHQTVPVGKDLVIIAGRDAFGALGEKDLAREGKATLAVVVEQVQGLQAIEDIVTFPIALS